jgi:hypothetical protein
MLESRQWLSGQKSLAGVKPVMRKAHESWRAPPVAIEDRLEVIVISNAMGYRV